jgi:hypothetical protein
MDDREEFPFDELIEVLSDDSDLKKGLENMIAEIKGKNM